jgi:hypothetical protein
MNTFYKILCCASLIANVSIPAWSQCETAPMEGYRGTCDIRATISADGRYVYSSNGESIKQWSFRDKTITADWNITDGVTGIVDVSDDRRYVRFLDKNKTTQLFDTQEGNQVVIKDFDGVHAIIGNIALVCEVKSRTEQMTKYSYFRMLVHDISSGKTKALAEYDRDPLISASSGRVVLANKTTLKVYDFLKGRELFSTQLSDFNQDFGFSPDGKYVATYLGSVNIDTKKQFEYQLAMDNKGGKFLFTPDSKYLFYLQNVMVHQGQWFYGFGQVLKFDVSTGKQEKDLTSGWLYSVKPMAEAYRPIPRDENHFYVFDGKSMSLIPENDFTAKSETLDLFGNIGTAGKTQIATQADEKAFLESLKAPVVAKLNQLQPSDFLFPYRNQLDIYDYSEKGIVLIGDSFQAGVWKMPEGKLINGFGSDVSRMKLGAPETVVPIGVRIYSGAVNNDGSIVAFSSEAEGNEVTEVYQNGKLINTLSKVVLSKFLENGKAIAYIPADKKICVYDYQGKKIVTSFSKGERDFRLSPDQSKILIGESKIYDVQSGKLLLNSNLSLRALTNTKAISFDGTELKFIDITSGKPLLAKGWDANKREQEIFFQGSYVVTFAHDGPLRVFDLDKLNYVSDRAVFKFTENAFEKRVYFPSSNEVFFLNDQGFPTYGIRGQDTELATAYCVNAKSGEFTPYLWQISKEARAAVNQKEKTASEPDPQVTSLMNALKVFPDNYKFDYTNFNYLDITSNPVANKYFTYMGTDKIYALGRFCPYFGITKFLMLTIKNPGPHEQYNFSLVGVGPKGFVSNDIIASTQKVNGAVTELANVSMVKSGTNYNITITTESPSGTRTSSVSVPAGCY